MRFNGSVQLHPGQLHQYIALAMSIMSCIMCGIQQAQEKTNFRILTQMIENQGKQIFMNFFHSLDFSLNTKALIQTNQLKRIPLEKYMPPTKVTNTFIEFLMIQNLKQATFTGNMKNIDKLIFSPKIHVHVPNKNQQKLLFEICMVLQHPPPPFHQTDIRRPEVLYKLK